MLLVFSSMVSAVSFILSNGLLKTEWSQKNKTLSMVLIAATIAGNLWLYYSVYAHFAPASRFAMQAPQQQDTVTPQNQVQGAIPRDDRFIDGTQAPSAPQPSPAESTDASASRLEIDFGNHVRGMKASPDGSHFAVAVGGRLEVWTIDNPTRVASVVIGAEHLGVFDWLSDNARIAVLLSRSDIGIISIHSGQIERRVSGFDDLRNIVRFGEDILVDSFVLLDGQTLEQTGFLDDEGFYIDEAGSLAQFDPNAFDNEIERFRGRRSATENRIDCNRYRRTAVLDGHRTLAMACFRAIIIWDGLTLQPVSALRDGSLRDDFYWNITGLETVDGGTTLVSAYFYGELQVWNVPTGQLTRRVPTEHEVESLAALPDLGLILVNFAAEGISAFNVEENRWTWSISHGPRTVAKLESIPDSNMALTSADEVRLWSLANR